MSCSWGWSGGLTSLLPRPNPLITGPDRRMGYGDDGPESGPVTGSRGVSGRMVVARQVGLGKEGEGGEEESN